jgi:hypothetical protein
MGPFSSIIGFKWDAGNLNKNWEKHQVSNSECEEVFFNAPLVVRSDTEHSEQELRLFALGQTDDRRPLFVSFTIRTNRIRVISARDMTGRELEVYRDRIKKTTKVRH